MSMIVCYGTLLGDLGAAAGSGRSDEVRCDWKAVGRYGKGHQLLIITVLFIFILGGLSL